MNSERRIVFYLDFISPFAYLANAQLPEIAARHGAVIDYRPMDVMHAKLAAGNFAPSTRAVPAKARFIRRDRLGWAQRYGLPMTDPKAFRAPRLNSGLLLAADRGLAEAYANAAFHRVWGLGGDPDDDALLTAVAGDIGMDARDLFGYVATPQAQTRYREIQEEAYRLGVFGVPMMMVGDEMFWGNDRLDFLEECLTA
ncbi:MAG: nsaD [Noviherbaspirillum sp.]|jgi:2-hydroxychromene-2-carboxylate isomerase|nr:nsaD [Noviherbaspirillum sp.]